MKINILLVSAVFSCSAFSCKPTEKTESSRKPVQALTIDFYPSWGGSAEALLERKNGKDNLYSTYHEKVNGVDTVLTAVTPIRSVTADSVFALAENVLWNDDANHGTAEPRVGLSFTMSLKKGRHLRTVSWEELKNANELPPDIFRVIEMVNRLCPPDFRIY